MFDLTDKVAIVTGATKGIGHAISSALAKAGANVVIVSRNEAQCEQVASEISAYGAECFPFASDISHGEGIKAFVSTVKSKFGRIDILVNNAGTAVTKPALEITEEDWDKVVDLNLKGTFFLSQAVGKEMIEQGGGRIINIASMFGLVGDKHIMPYLASKGGVVQITKGLALEWAKYKVNVNAVAPGYVITSMNENELNDQKISSYLLKKTPLGRFGTPEEIASMVVYLSSDEASYVTGAVFSVDGGWTAQ